MKIFAVILWFVLIVVNRQLLVYYRKKISGNDKIEVFFLFFLYGIPPLGTIVLTVELVSELDFFSKLREILPRVKKWFKGEQ